MVGGGRPPSLVEVRKQDRVPRYSVEQILENFVPVQILDGPLPQSSMGGVQDQILQRTAELVCEEVMLVIEVPKISFQDRIHRRASFAVPQMAEQLVEVPVPVPSFSDWVRWEETYWRTGHMWLGGFEWCLIPSRRATASPGRYTNTGQGSRRRPWYRTAAAVKAVHAVLRQSGGRSWFRLVPTVQTVQRGCGAG